MNALVTGGAGFIGSHLCDALVARGMNVTAVDNLCLGRKENLVQLEANPLFRFIEADLLDRKALDRIFEQGRFDTVFHLAANSDIARGAGDRSIDLNLTFMTTFQIIEAMERHVVDKIFFASTSAVFGDTTRPINEDFGPLRPVSYYGAAKLASESYLYVAAQSFGVRTWILRFPNVVGERCTHGAVNDFITRLKADPSELVVLGDGRQAKPYMYVGDLVSTMLLVYDNATENPAVYHTGPGDLTAVSQIARIVIDEMGLGATLIRYTGGSRGWIGDTPSFQYDTSKIKALGYTMDRPSTEAVRLAVRKILGKA